MTMIEVRCPKCGNKEVIKYGKSSEGKQRYKCINGSCKCTTFLMDYSYSGAQPNIERSIIKMTANASGIRDISRVLGISTNDERQKLKKYLYSKKYSMENKKHAKILLNLDEKENTKLATMKIIAGHCGVSEVTLWNVRKKFVEQGLTAVLNRKNVIFHPANPKSQERWKHILSQYAVAHRQRVRAVGQ